MYHFMECAVFEPCHRLGYLPLKEEQRASILAFLEGKDVFVVCQWDLAKLFATAVYHLQ